MKTVGAEGEYHIIDRATGEIANAAPLLLGLLSEDGYTKEIGKSTLEIITKPHNRIRALDAEYRGLVARASQEAASAGYHLMPASTIAPEQRIEASDGDRYQHVRILHGEENIRHGYDFNGIHIHVARQPDEEQLIGQYNLFTAAHAPVVLLASSSPIYRGTNHYHNYRIPVRLMRVSRNVASNASLQPYIESLDSYENWRAAEHDRLQQKALSRGADPGTVRHDRVGGHIRIRPHTVEARSADSNTPSIAAGLAALYLGLTNATDELDITIGGYLPGRLVRSGTAHLPEFTTIQRLSKDAVKHGKRSAGLTAYAHDLLDLAGTHLDEEDAKFLSPLERALNEPATMAELISQAAHQRRFDVNALTREQGQALQLLVADYLSGDLALTR